MLPIVFPDPLHPERFCVRMGEYTGRMGPLYPELPWDLLELVVTIVHDWLFSVVQTADRLGEDPVRAIQEAVLREPPRATRDTTAAVRRFLHVVVDQMVEVNCRELPYRGLPPARRAQVRFDAAYGSPAPKRRRTVVHFAVPATAGSRSAPPTSPSAGPPTTA